jgi:hypothetical protein
VKEESLDGETGWSANFADERFDSALDLIDSALLTIERGSVGTK